MSYYVLMLACDVMLANISKEDGSMPGQFIQSLHLFLKISSKKRGFKHISRADSLLGAMPQLFCLLRFL